MGDKTTVLRDRHGAASVTFVRELPGFSQESTASFAADAPVGEDGRMARHISDEDLITIARAIVKREQTRS